MGMSLTSSKLLYLVCILKAVVKSNASTHWVVTEDGRIQARVDSVFQLRRPYDLMALIQQEERLQEVEKLKDELMSWKEVIDQKEDKEVNIEEKLYATDENCISAGQPLTEMDLYISTLVHFSSKNIVSDDHINTTILNTRPMTVPNCSEIMDLDFSMHAFEHLVGVRERYNLTMPAEEGLIESVTSVKNIDEFGHLVNEALLKNQSSWILYNLAAYFWREKGEAANAVECVRRALHFSSRENKDVALLNLGNILHRAHFSEDAAVAVHAAVDLAQDNLISHYTLGNIYAVLADYNKSASYFGNTLKMQPDFLNAKQRLHALLCHSKLEKALEEQHESLKKTLGELQDYQKKQELWLQQQSKLLSEQAPLEVKLEQRLQYEEQKIRESLDGRGRDCFRFEKNGHAILSCNMRRETFHQGNQAQLDLSLNVQLVKTIESKAGKLEQKISAKVIDHCQHSDL